MKGLSLLLRKTVRNEVLTSDKLPPVRAALPALPSTPFFHTPASGSHNGVTFSATHSLEVSGMSENRRKRRAGSAGPGPQRGFTLLEVLIAVVVMAVGLLGIAALQTVGIRNSHASMLVNQATFLGNDMAERIRANPEGVEDGDYDSISFTSGQTPPSDPGCMPGCSAAQVAAYDVHEWTTAITETLTSGGGSVTENNDGTFTINITWVEMIPDSNDGQANSFSVRFRP